ncbi:probable cytochrome P450 6a13 [Diorhabda sublineata]|uniref:probable cytochrome P450 6a13 n=1 Tax=Diorhabda sublineata TaxID=1163346 RepID=UPI0024E102F5|nr:probable cytochrome P450 6a13 [Diorhabda sublineata]
MFLIYLVVSLPIILYFYIKWRYSYWQNKGVFTIEPVFPAGSLKDVKEGKILYFDFYKKFYLELKKRGLSYGGLYEMMSPVLVPVDLELIKNIMLKDFSHFSDHGLYVNEKVDPLTGGLFLLEGEKWRNHRAKLTPTFTTGKMKMMFHTLAACSKGFQELLKEEVKKNEAVFIKELLARFTTDIIGSVAFGIECNCMKEPNNEFRTQCSKAFSITGKFKRMLHHYSPKWFLKAISFKQTDENVEKFFFDLVKSTIEYREKNNVYRKDFLQMLIELKNTGTVTDEETMKTSTHGTSFLTLNEVTAHSFSFFLAGFETSSTTMSFALLELAMNQDIQEKLRKEILEVLKKYDGDITYEGVQEMQYLDQALQETLRKYPPIPLLPRICTKTYKIPNSDVLIEKGTIVKLAVEALQNDPEIYPSPEKFDPDRWSPENSADRSNFAFLSFGEGPRLCIGMRFGKLQAKCGIITILRDYKVSLNEKTQLPVQLNPSFITSVKGGVWLNMESL